MEPLDYRKLAADVSAQHGIRVDADDPMMAVVTLNQLVLERSIGQLLERLNVASKEMESAALRVQVLAGSALAQEVKACIQSLHNGTERKVVGVPTSGDNREFPLRAVALGALLGLAAAMALGAFAIWIGETHAVVFRR